jgi:hypothetical protein
MWKNRSDVPLPAKFVEVFVIAVDAPYRVRCGPAASFLKPSDCLREVTPPLRKHGESQENDGETGSRCLHKALLAQGRGVADEHVTMDTHT